MRRGSAPRRAGIGGTTSNRGAGANQDAVCQAIQNNDRGPSLAHKSHDDAYERGLRDSVFLNTVRAAHTGQWDVLDALWWQAHPASPGPSGAPSPSASLRDLQRQAFSADGDAIGDQATAQRIRALETEIRDESRAIINALEAAHGRSRTGAARSLDDVAPPSESSQEPLASPDEATTTPPPGNRRRLAVAAGIAAALALGVVVGAQLTDGSADAVPSPTAPPSLPAEPIAAAVSVFERAQTPEDVPDRPVPNTFDLASFRSLGVIAGTSTSADRVSLYAARSTSNMP